MESVNVAFIGLGVIGYPVAGHIAGNGFDVAVHNRTRSKAEKWVSEYKGTLAESCADAAREADVVLLCVGTDDDVREAVLGTEGVLSSLASGALIVDHTTASAQVARDVAAAAAKRGIGFVDAPVSGGSAGAQRGTLSIMVGGSEDDFNRALPVLNCYGSIVNLMGPVGSGQLTKMVNQICIANTVQGLVEAIHFGLNAGLDMEKVLAVISTGAAQSWQLENRGPTILENKFDFGFAVDLIRKDLSICMLEARQNASSLPNTALIEQYYANLQRSGKGRLDFTSLFTVLHGTGK